MAVFFKVPIITKPNGTNEANMDYQNNRFTVGHFREDFVYLKFNDMSDVYPNDSFIEITEAEFEEINGEIEAQMAEQTAIEKEREEARALAEESYKAAILLGQAQILAKLNGGDDNENVL